MGCSYPAQGSSPCPLHWGFSHWTSREVPGIFLDVCVCKLCSSVLLLHPICFGMFWYVFICIRTFSNFLFDFAFDPLAVQKLVTCHIFVSFLVSLLPLIYSFILLWSENRHGVISVFLNLVWLILWPTMCCISWRTFLVCLRRMYILLLWGGVSISFMVLFRSHTPYWSSVWMFYPLLK